jgi:hypothetical protein
VGDLVFGIAQISFFSKALCVPVVYMAFPIAADPADRAIGPLSPLPCHVLWDHSPSSRTSGIDGPFSGSFPSGRNDRVDDWKGVLLTIYQ